MMNSVKDFEKVTSDLAQARRRVRTQAARIADLKAENERLRSKVAELERALRFYGEGAVDGGSRARKALEVSDE